MIIVLLLHMALFFPILALVAAFFMRIPVLWVTMAFMPLTALGYVIDPVSGRVTKTTLQDDEVLDYIDERNGPEIGAVLRLDGASGGKTDQGSQRGGAGDRDAQARKP